MSMSITSVSELELSLISFSGSDSTLTWQGGDKRNRRRQEGWGGVAIIRERRLFLIFLSERGDYSREEINRGTTIIQGYVVCSDVVLGGLFTFQPFLIGR